MFIRRLTFAVLLLVLAGCVSQPLPEGFESSDDFDQVEAAKTRISLGLTYLRNGNYSQAKQNLDKALDFAPRLADSHYSIAYYYQMVGEDSRAESAYEDALSLDPRNPDIANSYGAFLCQQGRYEEAKAFFEQAVNSQTYANSAETYENMALCSLSQQQPNDAIEYLQTALNHQPTRAKSLLLLAETLTAEGQFTDAKAALVRYQRVARVNPLSLWLAVQIEAGLGEVDKAKGYGDMLLSLYPAHSVTQIYREKMVDLLPMPQVISKTKVEKALPEIQETRAEKRTESVPVKQTVDERPSAAGVLANTLVTHHQVQKGENLYRISLKYNVKLQRLIDWNELDQSGNVQLGMRLWVIDPKTVDLAEE